MFGTIGMPQKVHKIADVIKAGIQNNYQRIVDGENIIKSTPELDKTGEVFFKLVQEFFCEELNHFPYSYNKKNEEWALNCVWSSNAPEEIAHSLADSVVDIWLEKETPIMAGKQIMNRSFYMSDFINRKAVSCIPRFSDGEWSLLFEGGNQLMLDSNVFYKGVSSPHDLGFFAISNINNFLMTPAYSFGEHLYPEDISLEWHKEFLFTCAISNIEWTVTVFESVYYNFLNFLKENICLCIDIEPFIDRQQSLRAFVRQIHDIRGFLMGEDEAVISKDIFQLLNTRYVYLPYLFDIVNCQNEATTNFSSSEILNQMKIALNTKDTYEKGMLWEDVTKYVLDNIDGWMITGRRVRAGSQEIDLSVANVSLDEELWQLGSYILVECKNWKRHVDIPQIRNVAYISTMKGNKTALLFAANGITDDAKEEIERLAGAGTFILVIEAKDLKNLKTASDCRSMVLNKFYELQKKVAHNLQIEIKKQIVCIAAGQTLALGVSTTPTYFFACFLVFFSAYCIFLVRRKCCFVINCTINSKCYNSVSGQNWGQNHENKLPCIKNVL